MLKPVDDATEAEWVAETLAGLREDGFRVATPVRARDGAWIVDGWTAAKRVEGSDEVSRWGELIRAGEAFHRALAAVARPAFIAQRTHQWAVGDRVGWGEETVEPFAARKHVGELYAALRSVDLPSQVIHGDLPGNVLFAPGLPPAVIDFSPYWRPAGFATAIVVADALTWYGADERILDDVDDVPELPQLLLRAMLYRLVTDAIVRPGLHRPDNEDPYRRPVELALALSRP